MLGKGPNTRQYIETGYVTICINFTQQCKNYKDDKASGRDSICVLDQTWFDWGGVAACMARIYGTSVQNLLEMQAVPFLQSEYSTYLTVGLKVQG